MDPGQNDAPETMTITQQIAQLESENAALERQKRDLERELQKQTRLHESAMLLMRDKQKEHSEQVEVLTSRIKSLGTLLEHCAEDARNMTRLKEELDTRTMDCRELESACLELDRELTQAAQHERAAEEDHGSAEITAEYELRLSQEREQFQLEIHLLERRLKSDRQLFASAHSMRTMLEDVLGELISISSEVTQVSKIAALQHAVIRFLETHVDSTGQARLREYWRRARILDKSGGALAPSADTDLHDLQLDGRIRRLSALLASEGVGGGLPHRSSPDGAGGARGLTDQHSTADPRTPPSCARRIRGSIRGTPPHIAALATMQADRSVWSLDPGSPRPGSPRLLTDVAAGLLKGSPDLAAALIKAVSESDRLRARHDCEPHSAAAAAAPLPHALAPSCSHPPPLPSSQAPPFTSLLPPTASSSTQPAASRAVATTTPTRRRAAAAAGGRGRGDLPQLSSAELQYVQRISARASDRRAQADGVARSND